MVNRFRIQIWGVVLVVAVVALGAAGVIIYLVHRADTSRQAEFTLSRIEEKSIHIDALEWQALAQAALGSSLDPALVDEVSSANTEVNGYFDELDPNTSGLAEVKQAYGVYLDAVRREIDLLGQGQLAQARALDQEQVDPSYRDVETAIAGAMAGYLDTARDDITLAYIGSASTAVVAAVLVGLLFWLFNRERLAVRVAEAEGKAVAASEEHFRSLVQNSSDVIMILSSGEAIGYTSASAARVLYYAPKELTDRNFLDLVFADDRDRLKKFLDECARNPSATHSIDFRFRLGDGRWAFLEAVASNLMDDPAVGGIVINARDITDRKRTEEMLRSLSLVDDLTGLYNRRGFQKLSEQQLRYAHRTSAEVQLLFIDLDNMKWINDTYGHAAGDRALIEAAQAFRNTFRESDILGRYGGDEFAVLAVDTPHEKVRALVDRLNLHLDELNRRRKGEAEFRLSVSLGIASCPPGETCTVAGLLARADVLMYEQKREKKNRGEVA